MSKQEKEKRVVGLMISLYCKKNHDNYRHDKYVGQQLCPDCNTLKEYANLRIEHCPFKETKTFCSNCNVHCYRGDMREQIRQVMRFSGPRMIMYHPILAVQHLVSTKREKRRKE